MDEEKVKKLRFKKVRRFLSKFFPYEDKRQKTKDKMIFN
ncbi:hypothetical protein ECP02989426_4915 [Escherichia coli P0298942.6]|nr:hypothetical protein ECP02989421_5211 [Escherichia coli P0298942.1]ENA88795.1 hypothetical protein EC2862600_4901 [Escherichia coli 2862600]ENB33261.1 hypothetical protein ECP029894210_4835 [Escherichia coli P0298942.10]ENB42807.1 hypothetical protein ECP029894211_4961 [Escherichia coli P0298942.11]ENB49511.1 hypothetical protein ECP029894214_4877 [Escherichia coli P0298942.14]ENB55686.1 hypothetical protein ECP029894215_4932 [Escherichia coli P0298942.15]ENB55726.1 hypothetical protein EC